MLLHSLEYGSFLSYTPRPETDDQRKSKAWMYALKLDKLLDGKQAATEYLAERLASHQARLPFADFFRPHVHLVPLPKNSLTRPGTLWVPKNLVRAMASQNLGKELDCLVRHTALPKSATSAPESRPLPQDQFDTLRVKSVLAVPSEILLVDDIITSGSTALGAASRLRTVFPEARIQVFAMIRTISSPAEFRGIEDPWKGTIMLRKNGRTWRKDKPE